MRAPSYAPREVAALKAADTVIVKMKIDFGETGETWKEQEFPPRSGQTVRQMIEEIDHALRHHVDASEKKLLIYVSGVVDGIRMRASVDPRQIPPELV